MFDVLLVIRKAESLDVYSQRWTSGGSTGSYMDMIDVMIHVAAHSEEFSVLKQRLCDFRGL